LSIIESGLKLFLMNTFRDLRGISTFDPDEADAFADDPLFLRSVARTVAVMSAFQTARHPLSLSQVAGAAGIDRSAAQRIVHTLLKLNMLARDLDTIFCGSTPCCSVQILLCWNYGDVSVSVLIYRFSMMCA
jgi:hypothetical protein